MSKPSKPKPIPKTHAQEIAAACGSVSGIPDSLARAVDSLRDVVSRCDAARATAGILTPAQATTLAGVAMFASTTLEGIVTVQASTFGMHNEIGIPEKMINHSPAGEMELL